MNSLNKALDELIEDQIVLNAVRVGIQIISS